MDPNSQNLYTNASKVFPFIVLGGVFSIGFNVIMLNAMKVTSASHLGWPMKSGVYTNGDVKLNIIGFVLNIIIWTIILSIIIPVLKGLFLKKQ